MYHANAYSDHVGNPEGKRPLGKPRRKRDTEKDTEIGRDDADRTHPVQHSKSRSFRDHIIETSDGIKRGQVLDQPENCQRLNKDSARRNWVRHEAAAADSIQSGLASLSASYPQGRHDPVAHCTRHTFSLTLARRHHPVISLRHH